MKSTRTTIAIDQDVFVAAKAIAKREGRALGSVLSDLARDALDSAKQSFRNDISLLRSSRGGKPVTLEIVNALRDATP